MEGENGSYILNAKDLCMIEHIDKLIQAGVSSLKIEGRAKSSYYVAVITNAYRMALREYAADPQHYQLPDWLWQEVRKVSHRDYCTGFFFGPPEQGQCYQNAGYIRSWDIVAVADSWQDGMLYCTEKNPFAVGDTLELLEPGRQPVSLTVEALLDEHNQPITRACHAQMKLMLPYAQPVAAGSMLRKEREV